MNKDKEFFVLRYSLIEEQQEAIDVTPLPALKGMAIVEALQNRDHFSRNGVIYSFVGFEKIGSAYFVGKLAKKRKAHLGKKTETDIVDSEEDDWVASIVAFDVVDQYILIAKNSRLGSSAQLISAIEDGLNTTTISLYNHKAFVRGVTERDAFWRIVNEKRKLFKLRLKLVSPNILETDKVARDAIDALKNIFNQDETTIELKNDAGSLVIPKFIKSYIDYIDNGEGTWKLVTEGELFGKKSYTSNENIETIEIPVNVSSANEASNEQIDMLSDDQRSEHLDDGVIGKAFGSIKERRKDRR